MSSTEETRVDVGKIMADIKREIDTKGLFDELPSFDQVETLDFHIQGEPDVEGLKRRVEAAMADCVVSANYPVTGNVLKRAFKKASQKATRCSIGPMSIRITETNFSILQCLELASNTIAQQQQQINTMKETLEEMGKLLNGGAEE